MVKEDAVETIRIDGKFFAVSQVPSQRPEYLRDEKDVAA
jgi:hypothetical protein